jgi:hypothetical protein
MGAEFTSERWRSSYTSVRQVIHVSPIDAGGRWLFARVCRRFAKKRIAWLQGRIPLPALVRTLRLVRC